jgi:D-lactate dehydrogenase (cytochrome)
VDELRRRIVDGQPLACAPRKRPSQSTRAIRSERETAERLSDEIANLAIRLGGTATGEHGIGLHKIPAMLAEHDREALATMAALKRTLDPLNILNPGKMIPDLGRV